MAPRRTVIRPSEAARQATAQYAALGAASGDVRSLVTGVPALASGGAPAALFLQPFTAAALQAHFASLASGLEAGRVERAERGCPVSNSLTAAKHLECEVVESA